MFRGRHLDPGPFLYRAEDVAQTFVSVVRRPRDEVAVGWPARAGQLSYMVGRGVLERISGSAFRSLLSRAKPSPVTTGALFDVKPEGTASDGGWLARKNLPSAHSLTKVAVAAAFVLGCVALARQSGTSPRRRRRAF